MNAFLFTSIIPGLHKKPPFFLIITLWSALVECRPQHLFVIKEKSSFFFSFFGVYKVSQGHFFFSLVEFLDSQCHLKIMQSVYLCSVFKKKINQLCVSVLISMFTNIYASADFYHGSEYHM